MINHKRLVHENYKPKKCPQCERRFSTKALLEEHVVQSHNPEDILCNNCGKITSTIDSFLNHQRNVHKKENVNIELQWNMLIPSLLIRNSNRIRIRLNPH